MPGDHSQAKRGLGGDRVHLQHNPLLKNYASFPDWTGLD